MKISSRLVEPYAGLGAYSLRAMGLEAQRADGRSYRLEPPVSRVGNKAGFVPAVLKAWGLDRARWSHVWLNDLDPVCHLIHMLYASSELRDDVARRIWAMVPCPECFPDLRVKALDWIFKPMPSDLKRGRPGCPHCGGTGTMAARLLWERIRKEPVSLPTTFEELAQLIADALFLQSRSFQLKPVSIVGGAWEEHGYKPEVDGYNRAPTSHAAGDDSPRWTVAERLEGLPAGKWRTRGYAGESRDDPNRWQADRIAVAANLESLPGPGGVSLRIARQDAALCLPEGDSSDCVVVLDPPYKGATGYHATSCRADVLMLARAWDEAGALVILHEACGLASEVGDGWHEYPAGVLRGRRSTFHAGGVEREWITTNRRPVVGLQAPKPIRSRPKMVQGGLF